MYRQLLLYMVTVNFNMNAMATITITHVTAHITEIGIKKNLGLNSHACPYLRSPVIAFGLFWPVLVDKILQCFNVVGPESNRV